MQSPYRNLERPTHRSSDKELVPGGLGNTLGTATGCVEHTTVSGGWAGTDDDTSTAPSDRIGLSCGVLGEETADKTLERLDEEAELAEEMKLDEWVEQDELNELEQRQKRKKTMATIIRAKNLFGKLLRREPERKTRCG